MIVLACGSRDWADAEIVYERLSALAVMHHGRVQVIHGDCPSGADALAERAAYKLDLPVRRFPADWRRHARRAGIIRTNTMLDLLDPATDCVIAFHRNQSRGTQHTIDQARRRGIPVEVYTQ